jgi:acetyl esterase/lipase
MHSRLVLAVVLLAASMTGGCGAGRTASAAAAQPLEVLRVWPGAAPGSESWSGDEVELDADVPGAGKVHIITNVTVPTISVFRPAAGKNNGTAMLVLPGGAFRALVWDLDGSEVAQWLVRRGITAFVLKYRVRPPGDQAPSGAESFDDFFKRTGPARDLAIADAEQALRHIRANAAKYEVAADRVGAIGFSAGAMATIGLALGTDAAVRPNFAVSVYGAMPAEQTPSGGTPPLFVVAAQDDPQVPSAKSTEIYRRWTDAGRPAELHLYDKGGHGFGIRPRGKPADAWPAALEAWLVSRSLATPASGAPRK